jgi:uncharacterized protein (TIGR03118 family)
MGSASAAEKTTRVDAGDPPASGDAGASNPMMCKRENLQDQKAASVTQTNLIADQPESAKMIDTGLVNAWGLAFNPSGVAWLSANGTGLALAYDAAGNSKIRVTVPPPQGGQPPSAPTGQVFNGNASAFKGDVFIFATEDGTISGWQPTDTTNAVLRVDNSGNNAVYKGLTISNMDGTTLLLAADFHNNRVDVFDMNYQPAPRSGAFMDPCLPAGYAPFNVLAHRGQILVAYALQDADAHDDVKGAGNGFVDVFDNDGRFKGRLISRGALNSPWGMAFMASTAEITSPRAQPKERLLVGNFGDGRIDAYDVSLTGRSMEATFLGPIVDATGTAIVIDGLWAIAFGPGSGGFAATDLFFTAGPDDEKHGLFGRLTFP